VQSKEVIAEQWWGRVLRTYPCQTAQFLGKERDPFRNPVGNTLQQALGILLDELLLDMDAGRVAAALDSIVQIRAVQDFPPGQALQFIFQLKDILRDQAPGPGLDLLYSRIDEMALVAFDLYMKYREKTYEVRANEARRRVYVLERALGRREQTAGQRRGGA
jgi:hypothetical protein